MSTACFQRGVAVCALVLLPTASLDAQPANPASQDRLESLYSELTRVSQSQDHGRLRAIYTEIAALQPASAEARRGLGLACYLQGDFAAAVPALEEAASLQPDLEGVRLYLGISYYRINRFPAALAELEQAPELRANDSMARYWQGATYRALGQLSEAVAALEAARERAPDNPDVLQLLIRAYSEHSSEWFGQLLSSAASSPSGRLLKAEELAMDGVFEAALREADGALEEDPGLSGLHRVKGEAHWTREEYALAAAAFRLELGTNPCSGEAHLRLGAFLLDAGDPSGASRHLRAANRYSPRDKRVLELLGRIPGDSASAGRPPAGTDHAAAPIGPGLDAARDAYRSGDAEQASQLLDDLFRDRPELLEGRRLLAKCRLEMADIEEAVALYRNLLAQIPGDPEALYGLGRSYERLASRTADRLFDVNPSSPGVRLLRGESFERGPQYQFDKALAEFREAEALSPSDPSVSHAIGRVLFKMKRFDDAVPHLEGVLAANRSHGMANYLLGKIRLLQGDRVLAIELLRTAVAARPGLVDARRDLARALVLEGSLDEGIAIYEALLEGHPSDSSLHALLAGAYRRAGRLEEAKAQAEKASATAAAAQP